MPKVLSMVMMMIKMMTAEEVNTTSHLYNLRWLDLVF